MVDGKIFDGKIEDKQAIHIINELASMLTDLALNKLKLKDKIYKVADRDGMYVSVAVSGQITFRYDYRLNGRRETLTIGRYGEDGISLAEARDRCMAARKLVADGLSPAHEKQREKKATGRRADL
jgi:hypothetical protein